MLAPTAVLVAGVLWYPIIQAIYDGFTVWDGFTKHWIGLGNYVSFASSPAFERVVLDNVILLATLPILVLVPLLLALAASAAGRLAPLVRTLIFLPTSLSYVVIGTVGLSLFSSTGPVNFLLNLLPFVHITSDWLGSGNTAMIALLLLIVWALFGTNFIIYLSNISTLDDSLLAAGRVDGAREYQVLRHLVIPILSPTIRFVTILSVTAMYTSLFSLIFVFTGGGPGYSTTTLEFYSYQLGFSANEYGAAAAAGVLLLLLVFVVNLFQLRRFLQRGDGR